MTAARRAESDDDPFAGANAAPRFAPLYRQIQALLMRSLHEGEWRPGEAIPSEGELATRYRVSQGTVRKAVDALAAAHLLIRRQGRGTFVASHHEVLTQVRFLRIRPDAPDPEHAAADQLQADGSASASAGRPLVSRFLDLRRQRASASVAIALNLRPGDPVLLLRRLLEFDRPTVLDEIWLPAARFRGLTTERIEGYSGPLYGLFEESFGVQMIRATERLKAVAADRARARLLQVAAGKPLLLVERLSFTYEEQPVEVRRGYCVTAHHHYYTTLN